MVYTKAAMERAMKVQEVILRAISKQIHWFEAAKILGLSARQLRRLYYRYKNYGYDGLYDRRSGKPSPRRVPLGVAEQVFALYREKYFDFSVRHFHEKLWEEHGILLSYSWVKLALQGAGLVDQARQRGVHRRRRERRPTVGMMLHIDGSRHRWLGGEQWHDLIVAREERAELRDLATTAAARVAAAGDPHARRSQPLSARELHRGVQPQVCRGGATGERFCARGRKGFGAHLHTAARARGEPRQHHQLRQPCAADRAHALARHAGGMPGGDVRAPGRLLDGVLRTPCGRALCRPRARRESRSGELWKRRCAWESRKRRGIPTFPQLQQQQSLLLD